MQSVSTSQEIEEKPLAILGNQAVAYGLLDGGTEFAAAYPGTPSTEVMEQLVEFSNQGLMRADWVGNEAIALLEAAGAAISGVNSAYVSKHVGLNVAMDPLMSISMTGVRGSLVLVVADDPAMHSSQNEQDNRLIAQFSGLPMFEPATIQECYDLAREAVAFSRKFETPVFLRMVTRVSHALGAVRRKAKNEWEKLEYVKDPKRFVVIPANARVNHHNFLEKSKQMQAYAEEAGFWKEFSTAEEPEYLVITSGSSSNYAKEAIESLGLKAHFFIPQLINPLPLKKIASLLRNFKKVLVIEELEPYLERQIRELAQREKLVELEILGKEEGLTLREGELTTEKLMASLARTLKLEVELPKSLPLEVTNLLRPRPPVMCPGCPHRATYVVLSQVLRKKNPVYCNDIGCYSLGVLPPHNAADIILCMGSSISTASSISKLHPDKTAVAVIGDSTFWHSGLAGLASAIWQGVDILVAVLDNGTTAMTGDQPNPSARHSVTPMSIEKVTEALGAHTIVIDPFEIKESRKKLKELMKKPGVKVVVSRKPCAIPWYKEKKKAGTETIVAVDPEKCNLCGACLKIGCPAISKGESIVEIDPTLCVGCNYCIEICARDALYEVPLRK